MCGFAGFLSIDTGRRDRPEVVANRMADTIRHRGPDDDGVWVDAQVGIALAFRRLSIVDLSPAGHQPMESAGRRFVVAFNGEIYNHAELRSELVAAGAAPAWRGHSDTETLLQGFEHWGVEQTLARTVGMFAIALWDTREQTLHLARDRFGEKPLYYGWVGNGSRRDFVFGSELKALRAYPGFGNRVCRQALAQYMRFTYVPAPRSIYEGIYKLEPGCLISVRGPGPATPPSEPLRPPAEYGNFRIRRWWSLADVVRSGQEAPMTDEHEAVAILESRLADAVRLQSLADVPLGAFLSGGVDSSTIVALMQKQSSRPVKTFTVGFEEAGFDESRHARAVAQHLGTDHAELFVTAAEARSVICNLPTMYDEPFADSSQIPTHLVCRAARQEVTVALSGDAGDELFGGYNRYIWGPRIWNCLAWLPFALRQSLGSMIGAFPVKGWDAVGRQANTFFSGGQGMTRPGEKLAKLGVSMRGGWNMDALYLNLVSVWQDPADVVRGHTGSVVEPLSLLDDPVPPMMGKNGTENALRMMFRDSVTYLPDDILCKVDRAAMAVSLETRVPFLDHRLAELAWRLPLGMKVRGGQGKWALRQVLYKYVPSEMIDRPKAGFGIPVGEWLRGPLREWAEALLNSTRLDTEGYFHSAPIRRKWSEHLAGSRDHTASLWAVLMFQSWLESLN